MAACLFHLFERILCLSSRILRTIRRIERICCTQRGRSFIDACVGVVAFRNVLVVTSTFITVGPVLLGYNRARPLHRYPFVLPPRPSATLIWLRSFIEARTS